MTRDEEVALVATMAAQFSLPDCIGEYTPADAAKCALEFVEAAEAAVDSKHGLDGHDRDRLEQQVKTVLMLYDELSVEAHVDAGFALVMGGLRKALAACQPEEPAP